MNPILLLVILGVKSYSSQDEILLVVLATVVREEAYGAYGSLH